MAVVSKDLLVVPAAISLLEVSAEALSDICIDWFLKAHS
jgi:hypothetical protein